MKHSCLHEEDFKMVFEDRGSVKADLVNIKNDIAETRADIEYIRERIDSAIMPLIYKIGIGIATLLAIIK